MPTKRSYADHGDSCLAAHALDLVGDRWSVVICRELVLGPKRFSDLAEDVRGISPATLTARLNELQANGVLASKMLPAPARVKVYALTAWGASIEPVLQALGKWASGAPQLPDGGLTPDALVLAMRTMAPQQAAEDTLRVALDLYDVRTQRADHHHYSLAWDTEFTVLPGTETAPNVTIRADSSALTDAIFRSSTMDSVAQLNDVVITGEQSRLVPLLDHYRAVLA